MRNGSTHADSSEQAGRGYRRIVGRQLLMALVMALTTGVLAVGPVMAASPAINLNSSSCPYAIVRGQKSGCVTELQGLLNSRGASLVVDGSFGPATLAAVKSFQASKGLVVDGFVGPATKAALYATSTPPPAATDLRAKIVAIAEAELNAYASASPDGRLALVSKYQSSIGLNSGDSWCAAFVSWVVKQAGATSFQGGYVPDWVNEATAGGSNLSVAASPVPGDLVAFDWVEHLDRWEHIGVVRTVNADGTFTTVEGNTSDPGGSSDYGVYSHPRAVQNSYIKAALFIRVG